MDWRIPTIGVMVVVYFLLDRWLRRIRARRTVRRDEEVKTTLRALLAAGADLSVPSEVNYFVYFPSERNARNASRAATALGFDAEVLPPLEGDPEWLLQLTKTHLPVHAEVLAAVDQIDLLAEEHEGTFDGFGVGVDDDPED